MSGGPEFSRLMMRVAGVSLVAIGLTGTLLVIFWRALVKESADPRSSRSTVVKLVALAVSMFLVGIWLMRTGG